MRGVLVIGLSSLGSQTGNGASFLIVRRNTMQRLIVPESSRIFSSLAPPERVQMNTEIMTIKEVAEYLKLTEKTAYRLAAEGKVPGFKVGGSWRFTRREIDAWIAKQLKQQESNKQHQDQRGKY